MSVYINSNAIFRFAGSYNQVGILESRESGFSDKKPQQQQLIYTFKIQYKDAIVFFIRVRFWKHDVGAQWKDKDKRRLQSREGQQQRSDILKSSSGRWLRFSLSAGEASTEQNKNVRTHKQNVRAHILLIRLDVLYFCSRLT